MQISGELKNNKIIIKKPKEIGRLYNKSHFGEKTSDNKLQLNLIEGIFLLDENKIKIYYKKKEVQLQDLILKAVKHIPNFEIKYLVFKDLRKRGNIVKIMEKNSDFDLFQFTQRKHSEEQGFLVSTFSERDIFNIVQIKNMIKKTEKKERNLWIAIVDEEGDITYYEVSTIDLKGNNKPQKYPEFSGFLIGNRTLVFNEKVCKKMFDKEFFGKPFGNGLQLSIVETRYLVDQGFLKLEDIENNNITKEKLREISKSLQPDIENRLNVYKDLKKRGLIVKTGFKFGAHFRSYTDKPDVTHAEYLLHVIPENFKSHWSEISRAVRLAHSVNKEIVFARVIENILDYIKFGRLRP